MKIFLTNHFERSIKRLHNNQTQKLKEAITKIQNNPAIGELKVGDLAGVRVYKFRILQQLILLAYTYNKQEDQLTLIDFGLHENFYTKLKKQLHKKLL